MHPWESMGFSRSGSPDAEQHAILKWLRNCSGGDNLWQWGPPGVGGILKVHLKLVQSCRGICWWSLVGGLEVTLEGPTFSSLDPYVLPGVTSQRLWPAPNSVFVTLPSQLPHTPPGLQQSFCLFLASYHSLSQLLRSLNLSRKFLWICEWLCAFSYLTAVSPALPFLS